MSHPKDSERVEDTHLLKKTKKTKNVYGMSKYSFSTTDVMAITSKQINPGLKYLWYI